MVTKFLDLNNISGGRRSFVSSNDGGKVWATVLFLNAIMHRKFIYVNFFVFFSAILAGPGPFVEIQKCCYHGSVTKRLLLSVGNVLKTFLVAECRVSTALTD